MLSKAHLKTMFRLILLVLLVGSCTTDDIKPALSLTSDSTSLSEDNGTLIVTATLNSESSSAVSIPIVLTGTATANSDYSVSATEIAIAAGSTSGNITITGLQDMEIEGIETLIVGLGNVNEFLVLSDSTVTIEVLDDDSDSDGDGVLDANDDCPDVVGDVENNGCPFLGFLINEVNYDPAADLAGDANGDGTREPNEDEFIEFFNSGPELDLSGYTISDADQLRHTFPAGTILPVNGVLVVFGGGTPTGNFGGALVQTASEGLLNMSNAGDFMTIADPSGNVVLTFDIEPLSNNPNESYTRNPDLTGDFVQHAGIDEANGALFSPGTKLDGTNF
ncbi:lamin tail domain-containing protein [Winogradskyella aurantia]|uniref:Endonuclease n=1 Tax=Winogradskyella aurantia TaxID=1915063 RepID=A0A265UZC6_9FLAO|nr:lamin tail domain-containing protein [Winogradskyella aurantia]OZV70572.1 endonuclease [Winogradskyella aurantia]